MANRPTMRQLGDARRATLRDEMQVEIAAGRLTVRQMTKKERKHSDAHVAAHAGDRAKRGGGHRHRV